MGNGAYCMAEDVFQTTNTQDGKEVEEAEVYDWIRRANADIDSCLAGIYEVPFATIVEPFEWNVADDIPPLIRKWATKLASAYLVRKLFTAKAGKNISPYSDRLKRESDKYCKMFKDGDLSLLDNDGNIIDRLDPDSTNVSQGYSEMYPDPAEHVMPNMHQDYPDVGDGNSW